MTINIVRLGSLEHGIRPSKESFEKFKEAYKEAQNDGTKTIVWGPDIDVVYLQESEEG